MVSTSTKTLFTRLKILGAGDAKLELSNGQVHSLLQFFCSNLGWDIGGDLGISAVELPDADYFKVALDWFEQRDANNEVDNERLLCSLQRGIDKNADFGLFMHNLATLHKRRLKYRRILSSQPRPTMDQVGPRCLLEYGLIDAELLASWIIWRKWIFDVDNRSGQETGYLFEPILASCIGGEPVGSKNSPVKRLVAGDDAVGGGRQIDCYVASDKSAYEFKLRVTISASGQGRFGEELSFPVECRAAGLTPILLVLDPTPSNRLTELSLAFENQNGRVLIGEEAWCHLEEKAGTIMGAFIDRYIKPPLEWMRGFDEAKLLDIALSWDDERIMISEPTSAYRIDRRIQ